MEKIDTNFFKKVRLRKKQTAPGFYAMKSVEYQTNQFETIVRKAYSLITRDYTKMTEIQMMTLTHKLQKNSNKKESNISIFNTRPRYRLQKIKR